MNTIQKEINFRTKNKARDIWKKKYFNEKKKTPLLEENVNALLSEIQSHQSKIIHGLDSDLKNLANDGLKKETETKVILDGSI